MSFVCPVNIDMKLGKSIGRAEMNESQRTNKNYKRINNCLELGGSFCYIQKLYICMRVISENYR